MSPLRRSGLSAASAMEIDPVHLSRKPASMSQRETRSNAGGPLIKVEIPVKGESIGSKKQFGTVTLFVDDEAERESTGHKRPVDRGDVKEPAGKRTRLLPQNEVISIIVGKDEKMETFSIHKDKLCRHSAYFQGLVESAQPKGKALELEMASPSVFNIFFHWCYRGSIKDEESGAYPSLVKMIQVWVLGANIECPKLQDHVMTGLCTRKNTLGYKTFEYVYKNTDTGSRLRDWMIAHIIANCGPEDIETMLEDGFERIPSKMLVDLINAQQFVLAQTDRIVLRAKDYYVPK